MRELLGSRRVALPHVAAVIAALIALAFATPLSAADTKGEFDDQCAMGLASGQTTKTDCSVNWTDEDGHIYCFSSDSSKEAFLKDPAGNIKKAKDFLASKQAAKAAGRIMRMQSACHVPLENSVFRCVKRVPRA
jgi:YHS domain-containing protein